MRLRLKRNNHKDVEATSGIDGLEALDALDDSIVVFDTQWRYQFINKAGWVVLNRNKDDVIGKNVWELLPHLELSKFKSAAFDSMKFQKKMEIEEYYPHRQQWFRTKFFPSEKTLAVQITEITDLKKAQDINNQLIGDLQDAMEVYWSDENRQIREALKKRKEINQRKTE